MGNFTGADQCAHFGKLFHNAFVCIENILPGEKFDIFQESAPIVHRVIDVQPEFQAHFIVVLAVPRRRVHASGACLQGDMLSEQQDGGPVIKGMAAVLLLQQPGLEGGNYGSLYAGAFLKRFPEAFGNDVDFGAGVEGHVIKFGVH